MTAFLATIWCDGACASLSRPREEGTVGLSWVDAGQMSSPRPRRVPRATIAPSATARREPCIILPAQLHQDGGININIEAAMA